MIQDSNLVERVSYVENSKNLYSCKHPISFQKAILKQVSVVLSSLALLFRLSCARVLLTQVLRPSNSRHPVSNQQKPTHQTIVHGRFVVFRYLAEKAIVFALIKRCSGLMSRWHKHLSAWLDGWKLQNWDTLMEGSWNQVSLLFITWHKMQHLTPFIEYCSNTRKQAINPRAN